MLLYHLVVVLISVCCILAATATATATATTASSTQHDKFTHFKSWFVENGGIFQGIDIHHFPGMGNGFVTTTAVAAEQMILRIPQSMIFSITNLQAHTDYSKKRILEFFEDEMALITWLLTEREEGEESFFAPYLDILPTYVSSALYFTPLQLELLQTPSLLEEVQQFQQETKLEFEKFHRIVHENRAIFPTLQRITYDDYLWAATIFHSRGLRFRGQANLAPMADMFNYEAHPEFRLAKSGEFFLKHHVLGDDDITIYADRSQSAVGTQLYEDYGDNPNEIYLKYHGFVPDYNPFHCVKLSAETFDKSVFGSLTASHKQLLTTMRFSPSLRTCVDQSGDLSKQFEVFLTTLSLKEDEVKNCMTYFQSKGNNQDWATIYRKCGFEKTSRRLRDLMQAHHNAKLLINGDNLEDRTWVLAKNLLLKTVESLNYETDITDDEHSLGQLSSAISKSSSEDYKDILHQLLATKYRLQNKKLYYRLCELFGVQQQCDAFLHFNRDSHANVSKIEAVTEVEEELEEVVDEKSAISASEPASSGEKVVAEVQQVRQFEQTQLVVEAFNQWFNKYNHNEQHPENAKIKAVATREFRIGTIATGPIDPEEVYLRVSNDIIMSGDVAYENSEISTLLRRLSEIYKSRDDFHELLLFLIFEAFIKGSDSFYWPYINSLPRFTELDNPIFWSEDKIKERLQPSFIKTGITNYQHSISKKYHFVQQVPEIMQFFKDQHNFTLKEFHYIWASVILDSRSIWWEGKRHLVPMLDFVNCQVNPQNAQRVHSTALDATGQYAITKSGKLKFPLIFSLNNCCNFLYLLF